MNNIFKIFYWTLKRFWWVYVSIVIVALMLSNFQFSFAFCSFISTCVFFLYSKTPLLEFELKDVMQWGNAQMPARLKITNKSSSPINIVKVEFFDDRTKKTFDYLKVEEEGIRIDQNQIKCFDINTKFETKDSGSEEIPDRIKITTSNQLTLIYKIY